jgi:hypothetical protein
MTQLVPSRADSRICARCQTVDPFPMTD